MIFGKTTLLDEPEFAIVEMSYGDDDNDVQISIRSTNCNLKELLISCIGYNLDPGYFWEHHFESVNYDVTYDI